MRRFLTELHRLVPLFAIGIAALAVPAAILFLLPSILGFFAPPLDRSVDIYGANRPLAFTFLDADGNEVGHHGAIVGERLSLREMPAYLPAAFIAVEDRSFYTNSGIDPKGLLRAAFADLRAGRWVAGGSTITQQTAKIVFTSQERTVSRKLEELIDAAALKNTLTKQQILELYLNRLYLGSAAYGVDAAAHVYFGVSARNVTLAQAAMLATLTRAPSVFTPRRDLAAAQGRASHVLGAMVDTGAITQAEADEARAHPAIVSDRTRIDARNYFFDAAADEAASRVAGDTGDLVVRTTLMPRLEEGARNAAAGEITRSGRRLRAHEAAVVILKPDGAVAALVGGVDYDTSVFNRATQARRQPGSAFKPFVYLAALESGITPSDQRDDEAVDIHGWQPANYGGRAYGTLTIAEALAHSVNTITANLAQEVGIPAVIAAAKRCGIVSPLADNASLALGTSEVTPLELTAAYAAFANGGFRVHPYFVTEIDDARGTMLYRRQPEKPGRIIEHSVDRDLVAMLYGVVTSGTGTGAALTGHEAAGKTGTTQDSKDAWFVGFTADYVTGVWVGNDDSSAMRGVTGGTIPARIWKSAMSVAERGMPATPLDRSPPAPPATPPDEGFLSGIFGSSTDDEASPSPQQGAEVEPAAPVQRGGILGWLFGDDESNRAPPPPPAPPPPGRYERYDHYRAEGN